MDVKSLYTFLAVVDHGSFAQAAAALNLSASAISVQMRALEADVDMRLFDRSRRPPALTPEGRAFIERAREVIAIWEDLSHSLRRDSNAGRLRIGAVHTAVSTLLPPALQRLRDSHPNLGFTLSTGLAHDLEAALRAGMIDAALITGPETAAPGFAFHMVCTQRLVVVAHATAAGADVRSVLERNPYIRFSRQARVGEMVERALDEQHIRVHPAMEIDTQDGVMALVAAGLGVSVVPEYPRLQGGDLRVMPMGADSPTRTLGLMFDPTAPRRRFCEALATALRDAACAAYMDVPADP